MKTIVKFILPFGLGMLLFLACSKDDGPTTNIPTNNAPTIANQTFTIAETIDANASIGTIKANDLDQDVLEFKLATNSDGLFELTKEGVLSLAAGKQLNFNTKPKHELTVSVTDNIDESSATVTINVTEVVVENLAPEILEDVSEIVVFENLMESEVIVSIEAEDPEGESLTFKIATNDNDLFKISSDGGISLASGQKLDFETETTHNIVVTVTDEINTVEVPITISVEDVAEAQPNDASAFVTTWLVDQAIPIQIGLDTGSFNYDFTINWGDGTIENITGIVDEFVQHEYSESNSYKISIIGDFPAIFMDISTTKNYITQIDQWGAIEWQSMYYAFSGCQNLVSLATDTPDLSQVTDVSFMFNNCTKFNADLSTWNMKNITNMQSMFSNATDFDQSLGAWDISSVTNMSNMLDNSKLSTGNYGDTLIGWSTLNEEAGETQVPTNIVLGVDGLLYCNGSAGQDARNELVNLGWELNGDNDVACF